MDDLRYGRVLITGAAGAIGRVLRSGLAGRHGCLRLLDVAPLGPAAAAEEVIQADLLDGPALDSALAGVDALVHLAGASDPRDFATMYRTNVHGLYILFEAARTHGVRRIVFASSNHAYGMAPVDHPVTVTDPPRPDSFYGVTKVFGETLLRYYWDKHGIESVSLRIGSFTERPTEQRHLSTWLSPADGVALFDRALKQPDVGAAIVVGMSANRRLRVGETNWSAIGYRPSDDAESWAGRLREENVDVDGPPQWGRHGGAYEAADH
ncbi:MAG: NAD(P)-dependent oxidoreductase [Alphaproteobacteria bacterium]